MPRERPILLALQGADCLLRREARVDGPAGYRSALADRAGPQPDVPDHVIETALDHVDAVRSLPSGQRRIVSLAMATGSQCRPIHTRRSLAAHLGMSKSALLRRLHAALDEVERTLSDMERKHAA